MTTRTLRRRGPREYRGPARSCEQCFAWGILRGRLCRACQNYARKYPAGRCLTCGRLRVPVAQGVCLLCRKQAALVAGPDNKTTLDLSVAARTGQQLFLAEMLRSLRRRHPAPAAAQPEQADPSVSASGLVAVGTPRADPRWVQAVLFDLPRDCRHASSLDPPRDPRFLNLALGHADALAERDGWPAQTLAHVRRGLRMLAGRHDPGEPIRASTVTAMSPYGIPAARVLGVLAALGDDMVIDDRPDCLDEWVQDAFGDLPPRIRGELQTWIDVLRGGTPRRRPHPRSTIHTLLAAVRPFLRECAARYTTLREVTHDDVIGWLDGRTQRANDAHALRDLFTVLKTQRLVFTNPTRRIHAAGLTPTTPTPLSPQALHALGEAAQTDPALRAVLALIGVRALHPHQIRHLRLDEIDLPNQRLNVAGIWSSLDAFTLEALTAYLTYRHHRWPQTANPHLLLTRRTARERGPVSASWLAGRLRGLPVTLRQLREDRILEEARVTGGDPLHLATMFGLTAKPALRYAQAVHPGLAAHRDGREPTRG
jgi:hypothetical protein